MYERSDEREELLWIDERKYPNGTAYYVLQGPWESAPGGYLRKKSKEREALVRVRKELYSKLAARQELSESDRRDMELCRELLADAGRASERVSDIVREYLQRNPGVRSEKIGPALQWYRRDMEQRGCREVTITISIGIVEQFAKEMGIAETGDITPERVKQWVFDPSVGGRTQQGRRNKLSGFFRACLEEGAIARNYALELPMPRDRKPLTQILTVEQLQRLLDAAATTGFARNQHANEWECGKMLPYFAVCLLSGVRPTECRKMASWDEFFDFEANLIGVTEKISKTRSRWVPMRPNLKRILQWCRREGFAPGFFSRDLFQKVRQRAGIKQPWRGGHNDLLRHCFASYRDVIDRDRKALVHEMANSEAELIRSYIRQVHPAQAKRFDDLLPKRIT